MSLRSINKPDEDLENVLRIDAVKLRSEQVEVLYDQIPAAVRSHVVAGLLLLIILWNTSPQISLIYWYALLLLLTAYRLGLYYKYKQAPDKQERSDNWFKWLIICVMASGAVWGVLGIALASDNSIIKIAIAIIWICGLTAGAIVTLSMIKGAWLAFSIPALIPLAVYLLLQGGTMNTLGASALLIYFGFLWLSALQMHHTLIEGIRMQLGNAQLGTHLDLEKTRLEKMNEELEEQIAERTTDLLKINVNLEQEITERKMVEQELRKSHAFFRQAEKMGQMGHWEWDDVADKLSSCSEQYARIFEMSMDEIFAASTSGEDDLQLVYPDDRESYHHQEMAASKQGEELDIEYRVITSTGAVRYVHEIGQAVLDEHGKLVRSFGTLQDITERKEMEKALSESEERFRSAFDQAAIPMVLVTDKGRFLRVNKAVSKLTGYSEAELLGMNWQALVHPDEQEQSIRRYNRVVSGEVDVYSSKTRYIHKSGEIIWVSINIAAVLDGEGKPLYFIGQAEDVTEIHKLSEELSYQAKHDALTGLVNRREFEDRLQRALEKAQNEKTEHALCYLDLDKFKVINDTCGHLAGDELLQIICDLMQKEVRKRDTLARLGGDEFGVLMEHCSLKNAKRVADDLIKAVEDFRFKWEDRRLSIGVSIGIVQITESSDSIVNILKAADNACYIAKDKGRNRIHIYANE
jgi:diguanylate cyclase (GGDEF)-like protein/PAS domain S-box-containing protein